jgi:hypothetical protein
MGPLHLIRRDEMKTSLRRNSRRSQVKRNSVRRQTMTHQETS